MTRYARLLLITFLATAAEIVATRAVYYLLTKRFQFEDSHNLGVALGFSTVGSLGALFSHRIAHKIGHRTTLIASMVINLLCDIAVVIHPAPATIVTGTIIKGGCVLVMWPIVEGYVTSGLSPKQTASALGGFNFAWTSAIPIMLAVSGVLMDHSNLGVFFVPIVLQVVVIILFTTLEADPAQIPDDHPSALPRSHEVHYTNMLRSARFTMLSMGAAMAFITPILPHMLINDLGYTSTKSTAIAAITDVARVAAIVCMYFIPWWHGRRSFLLCIILAVPIGLVVLMKGGSITTLIIGEVIFGLASGASYFAGIYYAMVLHRSSEGGAMHEMIGQVGSILGPGAGLVGDQFVKSLEPVGRLFGRMGIRISGPLLGLSPVLAFLTVAALLPLRHKRPDDASPPEPPLAA